MTEGKLNSEEMAAIRAKNKAIVDSLAQQLKTISQRLSEIIESYDAESVWPAPKALYELMRTVLDHAIESVAIIMPEDPEGFRKLLDENYEHIDVLDAIIDDRLAGSEDRAELRYNVRQYVKDYLYGICMILENDPKPEEKEIVEYIVVLSDGLREMLLLRAGCMSEDL
jgi:hypothetical protein